MPCLAGSLISALCVECCPVAVVAHFTKELVFLGLILLLYLAAETVSYLNPRALLFVTRATKDKLRSPYHVVSCMHDRSDRCVASNR